jgi:hypothetical protein
MQFPPPSHAVAAAVPRVNGIDHVAWQPELPTRGADAAAVDPPAGLDTMGDTNRRSLRSSWVLASGDGVSSSIAKIGSLKHYASLLVAEKPLDAHRAFVRQHSTSLSASGGSPNRRPQPSAPSPFDSPRVQQHTHTAAPPRPRAAAAAANPLEGIEGTGDPEYEVFRRKFKTGRLYRLVRGQIMRNKRRHGRAAYLEHLKVLYNSIVPSSGRVEAKALPMGAGARAYAYMAAMVSFDFVTPMLLTVNASFMTCFLIACFTFTTMMMAGQRQAWFASVRVRSPPLPCPLCRNMCHLLFVLLSSATLLRLWLLPVQPLAMLDAGAL